MVETIMAEMNPRKLPADWIGRNDFVPFQQILTRETDDSRYRILSQLLANEFSELKTHQAEAQRAG